MDLDLSQLPPAYRAAFEAQQAQIAALTEANARLEHLVAEFRQAVYGKKSEKLRPNERQLAFEDLETAVAQVEAATADATPSASRSRRDGVKRNLGRLPVELPRIERVIEPDSIACPCGCGCGPMHRIGEGEPSRRHAFETDGEHQAPRHRAGAVPGDRDDPAEVRLPPLPGGRDPGAGSTASDRGRTADRGADRAHARLEIRRSPAIVSPSADLCPLWPRPRPLHARRLGGQGRVPPRPRGRPAHRPFEAIHQALHG